MKKILNILIIYNLICTFALIGVGFLNINGVSDLFVLILFIPLVVYFALLAFKKAPIIKKRFSKNEYKKITKYLSVYSFFFSTILFLSLVGNIKSFLEIIFIVLLLPLELYFALVIIDKINKSENENKDDKSDEPNEIEKDEEGVNIKTAEEETKEKEFDKEPELIEVKKVEEEKPKDEVKEKDRRDFLKIIAGAGAGMVLTGLVNPQKAGAAFFGSVPGPGTIAIKDTTGTKIDPSIKSPTDGYGIMNTDEASYPYYYGFVNKDGAWYIVKAASDGSFTYAKGSSSYPWSSRASQTYGTFDTTF